MPKLNVLTWAKHKEKWSKCSECDLCLKRHKIVLARGKIPCDVLVVGEAPGPSEDTIGQPFIGPSGKLLDDIISYAKEEARSLDARFLMTNLVACTPKDGTKHIDPSKEAIKACSVRLQELVELSKPKAIIMVGKLSQKYCPQVIDYDFAESSDLIHPAAILRMDVSQRGLAVQRSIVVIRDLLERI